MHYYEEYLFLFLIILILQKSDYARKRTKKTREAEQQKGEMGFGSSLLLQQALLDKLSQPQKSSCQRLTLSTSYMHTHSMHISLRTLHHIAPLIHIENVLCIVFCYYLLHFIITYNIAINSIWASGLVWVVKIVPGLLQHKTQNKELAFVLLNDSSTVVN